MNFLTELFSHICGQVNCSTLDGVTLPLCQRCVGLYCGALVAFVFWNGLRPRMTNSFLALNVGFLILMIPFGFHWVQQDPTTRMLTGFLFGVGLFGCFACGTQNAATNRALPYWSGVILAGLLLMVAITSGGSRTGYVVTALALAGMFVLLAEAFAAVRSVRFTASTIPTPPSSGGGGRICRHSCEVRIPRCSGVDAGERPSH